MPCWQVFAQQLGLGALVQQIGLGALVQPANDQVRVPKFMYLDP